MLTNFDSAELLGNYTQVKTCIYKGETYSVRDNGAVLRHKPECKPKPRPLDEKWTFGKKDLNTVYAHWFSSGAYHCGNSVPW